MLDVHPSSLQCRLNISSRQISFPPTQAKRVPKYLIFSYIGRYPHLNGRFLKILSLFCKNSNRFIKLTLINMFHFKLFSKNAVTPLKGAFLLILCFPAAAFAQTFTKAEIVRFNEEAKAVTIIRDNWGIPHIYGKTDANAVFGLMYAECEDNFKGIEQNYLYQLGKQAEVDGEKSLYQDVTLQLIADTADAIADYRSATPWFKQLMDAFADGVNYFLYTHPDVKPAVFQRFKPWFALMFTDGSVSATVTGGINLNETSNFYGGGSEKIGEVQRPGIDEREMGSNGFAIAPARSASGHAMLYINPHVPFYFRDEVQISSDEGLDVYGAVTWGQFFIYQGFNRHCGWMHTSSNADVGDLYAEKVLKKDGKWF